MKNILNSSRSKYIFALGLLAIGIGVVSKNLISHPSGCEKALNLPHLMTFNI